MHLKSQVLSVLNPRSFPEKASGRVHRRLASTRHAHSHLSRRQIFHHSYYYYYYFLCPEVLHSPRDLDIAIDFSLMSGWSGLVVCGGESAFKSDQIEALDAN